MNRLDELILQWQEGQLTSDDLRQLNALLENAEHRRGLHDQFLLSTGLRGVGLAADSRILPLPSRPAGPAHWRWITAAAASIAFFALLVRFVIVTPLTTPESAFLADSRSPLAVGQIVRTEEGEETQISFDRGRSTIRLHGATALEIVSLGRQKEFRLQRGSLRAKIAPQRAPLQIFSPLAEASVLGTEFTLSALPYSTRLDVLRGKVRFMRLTDGRTVEVDGREYATASPEIELAALPLPPAPWGEKDIGAVALHGAAFVDGGKCLIRGAGRNTCLKKDQLHYMYQKLEGDFEFRARLLSFSARSRDARAGLMIRHGLQSTCRQAFVGFRGDGTVEIQCRPDTEARELNSTPAVLPLWFRISREGEDFRFAISSDEIEWRELASESLDIGHSVLAGLAVTSFNNEILDESTFDHVSFRSGAALK